MGFRLYLICALVSAFVFTGEIGRGFAILASTGNSVTLQNSKTQNAPQILLAQRNKKKRGSKKKKKRNKKNRGRSERIITRQKKLGRDRKNLDFEEAQLYGARRTPLGSLVNQNRANKDFDLVKIRFDWQDAMVDSVNKLEGGSGRR